MSRQLWWPQPSPRSDSIRRRSRCNPCAATVRPHTALLQLEYSVGMQAPILCLSFPAVRPAGLKYAESVSALDGRDRLSIAVRTFNMYCALTATLVVPRVRERDRLMRCEWAGAAFCMYDHQRNVCTRGIRIGGRPCPDRAATTNGRPPSMTAT